MEKDIIKREAQMYGDDMIHHGDTSLKFLKNELEQKLIDFKRNEDKELFLLTVKKELLSQKIQHRSICEHELPCPFVEGYEMALFVVGQELDDFIKLDDNNVSSEDFFSDTEQSILNSKIDEIIHRLKAMDAKSDAQMEALYDELEDLKLRMQYEKKTFWQIAKGKLVEAVASQVIDKTVAKEIYNGLADNIAKVNYVIDAIN